MARIGELDLEPDGGAIGAEGMYDLVEAKYAELRALGVLFMR